MVPSRLRCYWSRLSCVHSHLTYLLLESLLLCLWHLKCEHLPASLSRGRSWLLLCLWCLQHGLLMASLIQNWGVLGAWKKSISHRTSIPVVCNGETALTYQQGYSKSNKVCSCCLMWGFQYMGLNLQILLQ